MILPRRFLPAMLAACRRLCLACLLAAPLPVLAGALHSLRFDHFSIDQGVPSTGVLSVYQSRQGYIWLGTSNGLARYDGRHMKVFDSEPGDTTSLSSSRVVSILEDDNQHLWVGSRRGLDKLDLRSHRISRQAMPDYLKPQERMVHAMAPAGPGRLWVACAGGLFLFDAASARFTAWTDTEKKLPALSPVNGEVRTLLPDGKDGIWFARGHSVVHLDGAGKPVVHFNTLDERRPASYKPSDKLVHSLAFDAAGRLWVGMAGGLSIWTFDTSQPAPAARSEQVPMPKAPVLAILRDRENAMWLAMGDERGLYRWKKDGAGVENFVHLPSVKGSLSGNSLTSLMQDNNGSLWIGTSDYGVNVIDLNGRGFSTYLKIPGDERSLSHELVTAVTADDADHAWVGTRGGGLNRLQLSSGDTRRISRDIVSVDNIRALLKEPGGKLWVGGDGLQLYDPDNNNSRSISIGSVINALARDAKGNIWAGTAAGLYRISPDFQVKVFRADPSSPGALNDEIIFSLLVDREQRLWVGSNGALHLWDAGGQRFMRVGSATPEVAHPEKLSVTSVRQDQRGRIWLATLAGLLELQADGANWRFKSWRDTPGLADDVIEAMQVAGNGDIWLSSERGLMQLQPDKGIGRYYSALGRFDGAFNFGAAASVSDGSLLFGSVGLIRFHPETLRQNTTPAKVVLSDLLLFNHSLLAEEEQKPGSQPGRDDSTPYPGLRSLGISGALHEATSIRLDHKQSMVSFELSALQFYNRGQNRYAWKLDGSDPDWIYGQADHGVATYTNLNPGHYRLLARAANPDGVWSESATLLEVDVLPPFWRTWWWYGGWLLLIVTLLTLLYRSRVRALNQTQLYLEQQVRSRTEDVLEQKSVAEAQREIAERARHDIGLLSEIGREITASLDVHAIEKTLFLYVDQLIAASSFGVGLVDWEQRVIAFDFVMHHGRPVKPYRRSLNASEQPAVRCVLGAQEIIVEQIEYDNFALDTYVSRDNGEQRAQMLDGSEPGLSRSALYVPLLLKGQVMGVVAVLSDQTNAFDDNAQNILRTLAAYAAVAFDNAEAYRRLQLAQAKLVEQEKMAALGSLVAGVAHELNTPIGNSLLMASTLEDMNLDFLAKVQSNNLRRSDLESFCSKSTDAAALLLRNLDTAASLISSFKQIAVDQTSDMRRSFDLRTVCEEVALTLSNRVRREGHTVRLEVEPGLTMDSFPGSLGQVLSNLILNAIVHALPGHAYGLITLQGRAIEGDLVQLVFRDNGVGIDAAHIDRIFEPFFTTRLGQGGSGLGLHICYNIICSILGGSISVSSVAGEGCCFTIVLPRVAPQTSQAADDWPGARPAQAAS